MAIKKTSAKKGSMKKVSKAKKAKKAKKPIKRATSSSRGKPRKGLTNKAKSAPRSEGTICPDPEFYCEFFCDNNTWYLTQEAHPAGYHCPVTLPSGRRPDGSDGCSYGEQSCFDPSYSIRFQPSGPESLKINTGDYLLLDGKLWLLRGHYDIDHYCPNPMEIDQLMEKEPFLAMVVALMYATPAVLHATVNVKAWRKPHIDQ